MKFIETPVFTKEVGEGSSWRLSFDLNRAASLETIYMLFVYKKFYQADLTSAQTKILKRLVQEELG